MDAHERKLLKLLSNNDVTFFIPPYQRNYEWTENQCNTFFDNVLDLTVRNLNGNQEEHFFGTIVYFNEDSVHAIGEPDKVILIDGQQRITSSMLLLIAIRDSLKDRSKAAWIDDTFLRNNRSSDNQKIKLKQVEADWPSYMSLILNNQNELKKDSAVYRNYSYFMQRINSLDNKDDSFLESMITCGLEKFSIVEIVLEYPRNKWENPQEIFESLNSLGKPLSLSDLIRNYLLMGKTSKEQTSLYNNYWLKLEKRLSGRISMFIRDYMQMKAGKWFKKASDNNTKELYELFKTDFCKKSDTADVLKDLESYAVDYSILYGERTEYDTINFAIQNLTEINVRPSYPFFMSLIHEFRNGKISFTDTSIIINTFNKYELRRRILKLGGAENKGFPALVSKISTLEKSTNKELTFLKILANQEYDLRIPNDDEVSKALREMDFYHFGLAKYLLSLIETSITRAKLDIDDENLQIEHIMPQTLSEKWKKDLGSNFERIHNNLLHNIGNLTLIRHNRELGNKPFNEKKLIYDQMAGLQIAKTKILDNDKWDNVSIKNRQDWIIHLILDNVLNLPEQYRTGYNYKIKEKKESSSLFSFESIGLIGETIDFIKDPNITAKVVNDREVEFEGKLWKLSPLTRELMDRKGLLNKSGAYQGAMYWEYDGTKLNDLYYK